MNIVVYYEDPQGVEQSFYLTVKESPYKEIAEALENIGVSPENYLYCESDKRK